MSTFKKICITNRHLVTGNFLEQIRMLAKTDIDLFVLREKDLPEQEYEALASDVIAICGAHGKPVMLHTFLDAAKRLDHPYIHLTMQDFRKLSEEDRRWFRRIGVSTHSVREAVLCEKMGADYVTASHIFPTDCKPGLQPRGLLYLEETARSVHRTEVYALGGITEENSELCRQAGADGACMMSGYMKMDTDRGRNMSHIMKKDMLLYAVTDRSWLGGHTLASQVESALRGGVTLVQLREKHLSREEFLAEAIEIKEICRKYHVPLIINDDVDIALRADADGVHVGQDDMAAGAVREQLGPDKIIGVSAHNVEEALEAEKNGADYLGVGAVFGSSTKTDANALDHRILRDICGKVSIPVVAIGGIHEKNILELSGTGIDGVAVVSAIFAKEDIESAARHLKRLAEKVV